VQSPPIIIDRLAASLSLLLLICARPSLLNRPILSRSSLRSNPSLQRGKEAPRQDRKSKGSTSRSARACVCVFISSSSTDHQDLSIHSYNQSKAPLAWSSFHIIQQHYHTLPSLRLLSTINNKPTTETHAQHVLPSRNGTRRKPAPLVL
jgi:hypothetical protein